MALGDPTRRRIIEMLAQRGTMSATEIAGKFTISAPAVSQHLKVLRQAQLIAMEKRAQQRIYRVNMHALDDIEAWVQKLKEYWEERFDALDALLEAEKEKLEQRKNDERTSTDHDNA